MAINVFVGQATLQETSLASASTCDIGVPTTLRVVITGTVTITSFGTRAWGWRLLRFTAALTLTHNATWLILPFGGRNKTTSAGDTCEAVSDASGNWTIRNYQPASGVVSKVVIQKFTSSGTYTPTAGMLYAQIECVGAGAGGAGATGSVGTVTSGGGGGSGSYSRLCATAATIGASQTVTIGSAGVGGASGTNNGAAGGDTSVGSLCIGKGGSGGTQVGTPQFQGGGGVGGVAGTGDFAVPGNPGLNGDGGTALPAAGGGQGASSHFGGAIPAGKTGSTTPRPGATPTGYGCGGNGGAVFNVAASTTGGDGAPGFVIITEFCA